MSYSELEQVWANFGGIWYPGIVASPDSIPDVTLGPGEYAISFSDGTGAALTADFLEPFDQDTENRMAHPDIVGVWDQYLDLVSKAKGETQDETQDGAASSGDDANVDDGIVDPEEIARKAARKEEKRAHKEAKRLKREQKDREKDEAKRIKKEEKKAKRKAEEKGDDDNLDGDELEALLRETGEVSTAAADRSVNRVRRSQIGAGGQHLEQPVGRIAELQLGLIKAHYNTVLASEVAGGTTRLMPFYERDYLVTAERAIQRRNRIERYLSVSLKKAAEQGSADEAVITALKAAQTSLRDFDLTKAFGLPQQQNAPNPFPSTQVAADAVELKSVGKGAEVVAGLERLKNVTRLYYRDQLTSVADGTSLVPIEAIPYQMMNLGRSTRRSDGLSQGSLGGGSGFFGGRFSSSQLPAPLAGLQATNDTQVMSQWRIFRELPPMTDDGDMQFIPPAGALAQKYDEAGKAIQQKALSYATRAFNKNAALFNHTIQQTAEIRQGINIGYNDIPAAGGPPAGPEDLTNSNNYDGDVIARQLLEIGGASQENSNPIEHRERVHSFLTLTQRASGTGQLTQDEPKTQNTQFNFHDFGEIAARKRQTRLEMGSMDHGSLPHDSIVASHNLAGSNIPENPLTPVNYGYDLDDVYRSVEPISEHDDLRPLKSNDLPSVASLWQKGSLTVDADNAAPTRLTAAALGIPTKASLKLANAIDNETKKSIRELFLKEAKTLTTSIESLLADPTNAQQFRSSSGVVVKASTLRDVLEYLKDVSNLRSIIEKLVPRALEQLTNRIRPAGDTTPFISTREAQMLRNSFRRQIERIHQLDVEGLNKLVPSTISRPASMAARSSTSDSRSTHSRSTGLSLSVRQSTVGQRRSRERDYDE